MVRIIDQVLNKYNFSAPEVTENEEFIRVYKVFRDEFYSPKSVLHPCCSFDASPSRVFKNVTYVDQHAKAMELMKKEGLRALAQDIRDYKPVEEHDLLILVRPAIADPEWATRHLRKRGYVLTEGYYGDAEKMIMRPNNFKLCGIIEPEYSEDVDSKRYILRRDIPEISEFLEKERSVRIKEVKDPYMERHIPVTAFLQDWVILQKRDE